LATDITVPVIEPPEVRIVLSMMKHVGMRLAGRKLYALLIQNLG
jgi:hypothetical protein